LERKLAAETAASVRALLADLGKEFCAATRLSSAATIISAIKAAKVAINISEYFRDEV
jgi:flagellar biosynthesis/type III secretory pathway ATPase